MSVSLQPTNESRNERDFGVVTDFCSMIFASLFIQFTAPGMWGVGSNPVCCWLHIPSRLPEPSRGISEGEAKGLGKRRLIAGIMYDLYVL